MLDDATGFKRIRKDRGFWESGWRRRAGSVALDSCLDVMSGRLLRHEIGRGDR